MATCDAGFPKRIDALLLGEPAPREWRELRAHLAHCASCRDRYNRVALAERMLHGGVAALDVPSPPSFARVGAAVLDGVAALEGRPARRAWLLPRWALGLLALGAAGAAIVPLVVRSHHETEPEFTARGGPSDPTQQVGIRAFCLGADGAGIRALDPGSPGQAPPRCGASELLKLAYSNGAGYEELFVVGFDESWAPKWYAPRPPSGISVPAERAIDRPVGGAVRLGVNHSPGPVRVFALFAHAPVAAREIEAAAARLRASGAPLRDTAALPLEERADVAQRSLLLEVSPP